MHECRWDNLGNCTVGGCEHPMVRLYKDDVAELRAENERLRAVVKAAERYRDALWADEFCCEECYQAGKQPSREWAALDAALAALEPVNNAPA